MAFTDFSETAAPALRLTPSQPHLLPPAAAISVVEEADADLSPVEWRVVELSRRDGLDSLRPHRPRSRVGRFLFGPTPPPRSLANERLEALRRLAVDARHHGWNVSNSAIALARKAGFSEAQIGRVVDLIWEPRPLNRRAHV